MDGQKKPCPYCGAELPEEASFCPVGQDKPHPQGNGCEAQPDDGENVDTGDNLFQGNGQGTPEDDCGQGKAGPSEFCWKHACSRNMCLPGALGRVAVFWWEERTCTLVQDKRKEPG